MQSILPGTFMVFQIIGFWKPLYWTSPLLDWLYTFYMTIAFFFVYSFSIAGIIGLIFSNNSLSETTNDCFIFLSVVAVCGKTVNVVSYRKTIIWMLDTLGNDLSASRNKEETEIQNNHDHFIWINTVIYGVLSEITVFTNTVGTLFRDIPIGKLPYNTYIPWDYSQGFMYWLTYAYQIISVILSANVAIAYDTLVAGMIVQVSAKLNILKYRFSNFTILLDTILSTMPIGDRHYNIIKLKIERKLLANYIKYHILIFKLASIINSTFTSIIFAQCSISTIVICVSVYNLANVELFTAECTGIILYLCCMLTEIFYLCAAGNEVTLVSESVGDAIYAMDWTNLNPSTVKGLIIIMSRTLHPIIFTSGHIVTLSHDSFKSSSHSLMETTNDCFVLLSIIAICGKTINVVTCRKTIIWILDTLGSDPCVPRNKEEIAIQKSMDRFIWINTVIYGVLTEVTVFMITIGTLFQDIPIGTLPYNTYVPWDYSQGFMYWLAYSYQMASVILSANVDIGYDTLVPGMIMQICAKLHILKYRLNQLPILLAQNKLTNDYDNDDHKYSVNKLKIERKLVADCVKYHLLIFNVYIIANIDIFTSEATGIMLYLCCMLMEVLLLYAAGNEVTIVSESVSDAIYNMDWTDLHKSTIKSLIIMMCRALRKIVFTCGFIVTLSLDSFKSLIKISYSTYNLLQRTSNN
ncbi:hypothetical protein PV328_005117 [Microctonus aethiopoides]|uniref:Odorant receptor n=1 Tax=Microctonus aethiopoides TaxID=144406 RepID=A0AA39FLL9_9HYME|nr:hypothetical protein PV328_005117 [Microctonus aethiopoides]